MAAAEKSREKAWALAVGRCRLTAGLIALGFSVMILCLTFIELNGNHMVSMKKPLRHFKRTD